MRGANPSGRRRESLCDSPHPFLWGGETPPHTPPRRRSAPPDLCIESAPGGNLPEGQAPRIAPPGEKAHLLPAFFGCGALTPRGGVENRFAILPTLSCGEGKPLPTPLPGGAPRRQISALSPRREGNLPEGQAPRHRATRRKSTPAPCILRMRGANPSGRRRESLRDSPHPFPWGGETPPHTPPRRRSAPPDLCIESAPGGNLPEGQAPGIAPPGEKAHLLPAFFGCGALTAFGGTRVSAESGQFSRWGRGARLTRRVREEPPPGELARVYFDRNATMSGA